LVNIPNEFLSNLAAMFFHGIAGRQWDPDRDELRGITANFGFACLFPDYFQKGLHNRIEVGIQSDVT
jgi:hypothetical protein